MKYTSFYTIRELDYKTIEKELLAEKNIPDSLRKNIEQMIADHKAIVKCKDRIVKEQSENAKTLFQLFEDPITQQQEINDPLPKSKELENLPSEEPEKKFSHPPKKRKKSGKNKLPLGKIVDHRLSEEEKICPCCKSKMHKHNTKHKTYVVALPMMSTETHISESYRCSSCEVKTTASDNFENQSIGRYHFSAIASLLTLRYQCGMPSYRFEKMSDAFGIKIADSTQWYIAENTASILRPFIVFLEKEVANAPIHHVDDTHNIILDLVKTIESEQEEAFLQGKNPDKIRSGIHTTNLTGVFPQGQIVLYKTGLHHSGEILAKILEKRTIEEQLIIMADAASANASKLDFDKNQNIKMANCNSHAVRKFTDLAEKEENTAKKYKTKKHQTSEYLDYFLSRYKIIFENDQKTKTMSFPKRLLFHSKNSLPLMLEMKKKAEEAILNKTFEPNDDIGKVYQYFLNHFPKFCAFCHLEGAPICNNLSERMLKSIIRHRKNSLFFKTQIGAVVADILTSILFTAKANDLNSTDYLRNLLLHKELWKENPKDWLPWNYPATIQKLQNQSE